MESWEEEIRQAVAAGEREFGRLDAHQTVRRNLVLRCEEILVEQPQSGPVEEHPGVLAGGDQL